MLQTFSLPPPSQPPQQVKPAIVPGSGTGSEFSQWLMGDRQKSQA
ncbi:hypothetical protein [Microcoleus sp. herbarium12]